MNMTEEQRNAEDAQKFHRLMALLRNTKMKHGLCKPRERRACTHCNALDDIEAMIKEYRGAPVRLA
jgi:hypothetical protein